MKRAGFAWWLAEVAETALNLSSQGAHHSGPGSEHAKLDGFAVASARQMNLPVRIVILTMHNDELHFNEAINLGVQGYVIKTAPPLKSLTVSVGNCRARVFQPGTIFLLIDSPPPRHPDQQLVRSR
jgi:hypothetical protein